jgi:hypothetical protein
MEDTSHLGSTGRTVCSASIELRLAVPGRAWPELAGPDTLGSKSRGSRSAQYTPSPIGPGGGGGGGGSHLHTHYP